MTSASPGVPDDGTGVAFGCPLRTPANEVCCRSPSPTATRLTLGRVTTTTLRAVPVELLPHLRRARDHIDRNFHQPLALDELASVAGVSKFHFARCFAASYGETPIRYLTRRRIERAQDLLRSANLTVTEVCMAVGFASLGSFSSRFRELVGETPSEFQRRWAAAGTPHIPGCFVFMWGLAERSASEEKRPPPAAS